MHIITPLKQIHSDAMLCESKSVPAAGGKPARVELKGVGLRGGIVNGNGRRYGNEILARGVEEYRVKRMSPDSKESAYGELGHPPNPEINLERVSHIFTDCERDGNDWIPTCYLTQSTPFGKVAMGLIEDGGKLCYSSRGLGSVTQDGRTPITDPKKIKPGIPLDVMDDYTIVTLADLVHEPSAPGAHASRLNESVQSYAIGLMESKSWVMESGVWKPWELEAAQAEIKSAPRRKLNETQTRSFLRFFESLKKA